MYMYIYIYMVYTGLLRGHKKWVTCLAWEPFIANQECKRLASGGKDGMTKIWDTTTRKCILSLGCHTAAVNQIKWGGAGLIYTASKGICVCVCIMWYVVCVHVLCVVFVLCAVARPDD